MSWGGVLEVMNNNDLDTLDDAKLSEVFTVEVAGYRPVCHCGDYMDMHHMGSGHSPVEMPDPELNFATDANAVLPWLEKFPYMDAMRDQDLKAGPWTVAVSPALEKEEIYGGSAPTFPRAACIALIKAHRAAKV